MKQSQLSQRALVEVTFFFLPAVNIDEGRNPFTALFTHSHPLPALCSCLEFDVFWGGGFVFFFLFLCLCIRIPVGHPEWSG